MPFYLQLLQEALTVTIGAITPVLVVLLIIGVATAILQSALQWEDQTLSLLLKTIAMILLLLLGGATAMGRFETLATLWIGHAGAWIYKPWW